MDISEAMASALLCASLGGEQEIRYDYGDSYNVIDCVTETHAIEFGLDKASSRDSFVQAWVASRYISHDPPLEPMVYIIGRFPQPGKVGKELMEFGEAFGIDTRYRWEARLDPEAFREGDTPLR